MPVTASVVSVNVGTPQKIRTADGKVVLSGIFKSPVEGRRAVRNYNIEGDRQADLRVHGGPYKAVYCYPEEHYAYWRTQLPETQLVPGNFGENLTTRGLLETEVRVGDRFRIGTAVLQVTQPRMPCFKLALRFGRADMVKLFWQSERPGIYFSIVEEGGVAAGDAIERIAEHSDSVTLAQVVALYTGKITDPALVDRTLRAPLFGSWKNGIRERRAASRSDLEP